jgi:hypothetical protein
MAFLSTLASSSFARTARQRAAGIGIGDEKAVLLLRDK